MKNKKSLVILIAVLFLLIVAVLYYVYFLKFQIQKNNTNNVIKEDEIENIVISNSFEELLLNEDRSVETINLFNQKIGYIPPEVAEFKNLKYFLVGNNYIQNIPVELFSLEELRIIDLSNNLLREIPEEIIRLKNLEVLAVPNNEIVSLPEGIINLKKLKRIDVSGNKISDNELNSIKEKMPDTEIISDNLIKTIDE